MCLANIDLEALDPITVATGLEDDANLCTKDQATLATRMRIGAAIIRDQQRRITEGLAIAGRLEKQAAAVEARLLQMEAQLEAQLAGAQ